MDPVFAIRGPFAGLVATFIMLLAEIPAGRRLGLRGVMEWHENQAIASRVLKRPVEYVHEEGLVLHFFHGALAGLVFVIALALASTSISSVLLGAGYGIVLWAIGIMIYRPITGEHPTRDKLGRTAVALNMVTHLAYGTALGLLVVWP